MLDRCPSCKDGFLVLRRVPRSGQFFLGCTNYATSSCKGTTKLDDKIYPKSVYKSPISCKDCGGLTYRAGFYYYDRSIGVRGEQYKDYCLSCGTSNVIDYSRNIVVAKGLQDSFSSSLDQLLQDLS